MQMIGYGQNAHQLQQTRCEDNMDIVPGALDHFAQQLMCGALKNFIHYFLSVIENTTGCCDWCWMKAG